VLFKRGELLTMEQNRTRKNSKQTNEKFRAKYNIGNSCLYQYKDPNGNLIQISRPAFIQIKTVD
jgi:hypothetical protein